MKKTIIALAAAAMLAACGQSTTTDPATGQQTSHDSGVSPLLAGALGYFMGRSMSPSPAPAMVPQTRTIIVNRTIQTPAPQQPTKPAAAPVPPPAVKTTPVVPPPAPRAIPAPTPAPKPSYSGPSSYRAPTTTFRSAPSGRR